MESKQGLPLVTNIFRAGKSFVQIAAIEIPINHLLNIRSPESVLRFCEASTCLRDILNLKSKLERVTGSLVRSSQDYLEIGDRLEAPVASGAGHTRSVCRAVRPARAWVTGYRGPGPDAPGGKKT